MTVRILIIVSGNPCRNPRSVKEASTLAKAGFAVTLLSPAGLTSLATLDQQLASAGGYVHRTTPDSRKFSTRALQWLARRAVRCGFQTITAIERPAALLNDARAFRADLTIVHNEVPHWVGIRLLAEGRRIAADFEDWYSEDLLPADRRHRPLRLLRSQERCLLQRAIYASTTSGALAAALHARYGGTQPSVITNSFPLAREFCSKPSAPPTFIWFSQTIGPGRGLETFLSAWKRLQQPSRLVLLGDTSAEYSTQLRELVPTALQTQLVFQPPVPPNRLPAVLAGCDIGLALEQSDIPSRDLTITNKILQYLNAGLAVVATATAGQKEVFARNPECGVLVDAHQPEAYAQALDHLVRNSDELARRQRAARDLAATHYCWEKEAPTLLSLVDKALN